MYGECNDLIPLYVGKAKNLHNRILTYKQINLDPKTKSLMCNVKEIEIIQTNNENDALLLEYELIKRYSPKYNIIFRDDKSYTTVELSNENYPCVKLSRASTKSQHLIRFGPFTKKSQAKNLIEIIQKKFMLRTCSSSTFTNRTRPCLYYELKQCTAPCVEYVNTFQYQLQVNQCIDYLQGNHLSSTGETNESLLDKINLASKKYDYESAIVFHNTLQLLDQARQNYNSKNNRDIIAIIKHPSHLCFHQIAIRNGIMVLSTTRIEPISFLLSEMELCISGVLACLNKLPMLPALQLEIIYPIFPIAELQKALSIYFSFTISINIINNSKEISSDYFYSLAIHSTLTTQNHQLSPIKLIQALQEYTINWKDINSIETVDASHWQGRGASIGIVHFDQTGFTRNRYRSYLDTNTKKSQNDLEMIGNACDKHFSHLSKNNISFPSLFCIDGGLTHLQYIYSNFLYKYIPKISCLSVSKGNLRASGDFTLHYYQNDNSTSSTHATKLPYMLMYLLQSITDEAHKYTNYWSEKRRIKYDFKNQNKI